LTHQPPWAAWVKRSKKAASAGTDPVGADPAGVDPVGADPAASERAVNQDGRLAE